MNRKPLRLGTSTSAFIGCMPEDLATCIYQKNEFSNSEYKGIEAACKSLAQAIAQSEIHSIEYFLTRPMLSLGTRHPAAQALLGISGQCEIWSVHAPFDGVDMASLDESIRRDSVEQMMLAADFAREIGAKVLTMHPGLEIPNAGAREERVKASGRSLAHIADYCANRGIRPAMEILPRNCIGNSPEELSTILSYADSTTAGICLDSNHSIPARKLPDVVRFFGSRLITLHISDHDDVDEKHWFPMKGVIDWPAFINSLRKIGYSGPFMYEVSPTEPDVHSTIQSIQTNYSVLMQQV